MEDFRGKTAVITGAASGIGRALAERFAELDMKLVLADVEAPRLTEVAAALEGQGAQVLPVVTDVSSTTSVQALAAAAHDAFGHVHLLCNNAGVGGGGPIASLSTGDWQWVLGVNLWGVINGLSAFLPSMLASGEEGHIVNTASIAGLVAGPMNAPYNASKFAVVAISEGLHAELAMTGARIGVSVLCPGFVRTDIINAARNRPPELAGGEPVEPPPGLVDMLRAQFEAGTPPAQVAELVDLAVRDRRLYVFTDREHIPAVEVRTQAILNAMRRL